ncbi:ABC transporter permease [Paenibacillus macerans]|uniref:ABC transporter permease n=1 Tax=Paenibacillus macerans TaxID=44252 RepID=UPI003D31CFE1
MFTIFKTMLTGIVRDVHTLFWTIMFPLAMLIGLGLYLDSPGYSERLLAGVLTMNVLFGAAMVTAFQVMAQRNRGVYKLLRATPFSTAKFILAMTGSRTVLALIVSGCIIAAGVLLLGVSLSLQSLLMIALTLLIGSACFTSIGFIAANLSRDESNVNMISNLISFPMLFTSEAFYGLHNAPDWVRFIGRIQPFHYFVQAMGDAVAPGGVSREIWTPLAVLGGFAAL